MLVALRSFCEGCYRISIISAFLCRRAKKKFKYATCGQGLITYNLKNNEKNSAGKCDGLRLANESTQAKIIRYLPAWGFPEGVEQLFGVTHHGTFEFL